MCRVTAQALFAAEPILPQRCEAGRAPCRALLQVGSYSFAAGERTERFVQLRDTIAAHVRRHPEALVVLEEFDRFDCGLRDMLREVRILDLLQQLALLWCRCAWKDLSSELLLLSIAHTLQRWQPDVLHWHGFVLAKEVHVRAACGLGSAVWAATRLTPL